MTIRLFLIISGIVFLLNPVYGDIINVPDDYTTIHSAINACSSGDTVLVQPGNYSGNVNFKLCLFILSPVALGAVRLNYHGHPQ